MIETRNEAATISLDYDRFVGQACLLCDKGG